MPNPLQSIKKTTQNQGAQSKSGLVPLIEQKIKKNGGFWVKWVSGWLGTKWEIWDFGWPAVGGYGGEGPAVVSRWWGKWMLEVGWAYLDFREERDGGEGMCCTAVWEKWGKRGGM
jgi:hypothetical protein